MNSSFKLCFSVFLSLVSIALQTNRAQAQAANLGIYNQSDPNVYYLSTGQNYSIPFYLREMGPNFSSGVRYSYSVNDGAAVHQSATVSHNQAASCVNAVGLSTYRVAFSTPVYFSDPGRYDLKIWIDSINGLPDSNHSNDTLIRHYNVLDDVPVRKGLLEYAFHVSCGPCGENGTPYIKDILSHYDNCAVVVKLHNYAGSGPWSALNCAESIEIDETVGSATHPECTFNRADIRPFANPNFSSFYYYPYVGFCPTNTNWFMRDMNYFNKVPVRFDANAFDLNVADQMLSFQLQATFPDSIHFSKETRISCMLLEDSIYGYQYDNGLPGIDSTFHRYVLRKVFGGSWGQAGSVPGSVSANQTLTLSFSGVLNSNFNRSNLYLVPTIQTYHSDPNQREILQVSRIKVPALAVTGIKAFSTGSALEMFPNPAHGLVYLNSLDGSKIESYEVHSVDGKLHASSKSTDRISGSSFCIPTADLANGLYLVSATLANKKVCRKKLVVDK